MSKKKGKDKKKKVPTKNKKKNRYSKQEKMDSILRFLQETKLPFTPKELSSGKFTKGIHSVRSLRMPKQWKEHLELMESDGLICSDKIGASTYYWSFPSQQSALKKRKFGELEEQFESRVKKRRKIEEEIEVLQVGKEDTQERRDKLKVYSELKKDVGGLDAQLFVFSDCDPKVMKKLQENLETSKSSAERWTDNTYQCQGYLESTFNQDRRTTKELFGFTAEWEDKMEKMERALDTGLARFKKEKKNK